MLKRWRVEYYPRAPDLLFPPRVPRQSDAPQAYDKIFSGFQSPRRRATVERLAVYRWAPKATIC